MKDLIEALNRAHKLDEAAARVATKRAGIIPGTIYKVMIKGADEFLLTERFTDIQAYLSNYATVCPSFNAVIYTMTNFRFKDIPYLYYEGRSYLNIDFSDSTAQSVIYVDGECKTQLNSENYSTPASSHLSDYTVRLSNTVTDFNDSILVSPRLESFKYKVVIDSCIHLFDTEQEAIDYYDESPSSRRLGNKFESLNRENELDEGRPSKELVNKIASTTQYIQKFYDNCKTHFDEFGGIQALGIEEMVKYYLKRGEPVMIRFVTNFGDVNKVADVMESYIQSSNYDARITSAKDLYHTYKRGPGVRTKPTLTIEFPTI